MAELTINAEQLAEHTIKFAEALKEKRLTITGDQLMEFIRQELRNQRSEIELEIGRTE